MGVITEDVLAMYSEYPYPSPTIGMSLSNADAFMHPIVNAYRFDEAMAMFKSCDVDWVAINGINTRETD